MFAISLGDGAELRPLEPWRAEEFLAHMDRGRDFVGEHMELPDLAADLDSARSYLQPLRRQGGLGHRPAVRYLARRHPRGRRLLPEIRRRRRHL